MMKTHGGDVYGVSKETGIPMEQYLDFSANINPFGTPEPIKKALQEAIAGAVHYPDPDCRTLVKKLSGRLSVPEEWILCGNGGADIIYRIAQAEKPMRALTIAPSFLEYEEALRAVQAEIVRYPLGETMEPGEDILEWMNDDIDLMFLCSPNNPTGILVPETLLIKILIRAYERKIRVVLDECFMDFVTEVRRYSMIGRLREFPHLVIVKSFTKMYGIPGIRLGYGVTSDTDFVQAMRRVGPAWAVNSLALSAGVAALEGDLESFVNDTVTYVERERRWLYEKLSGLGFQVYEGQADYLFFRAPGQEKLYERLLDQGIIIRRCSNYPGLTAEHYRVAVKRWEENERLIESLKSIVSAER